MAFGAGVGRWRSSGWVSWWRSGRGRFSARWRRHIGRLPAGRVRIRRCWTSQRGPGSGGAAPLQARSRLRTRRGSGVRFAGLFAGERRRRVGAADLPVPAAAVLGFSFPTPAPKGAPPALWRATSFGTGRNDIRNRVAPIGSGLAEGPSTAWQPDGTGSAVCRAGGVCLHARVGAGCSVRRGRSADPRCARLAGSAKRRTGPGTRPDAAGGRRGASNAVGGEPTDRRLQPRSVRQRLGPARRGVHALRYRASACQHHRRVEFTGRRTDTCRCALTVRPVGRVRNRLRLVLPVSFQPAAGV